MKNGLISVNEEDEETESWHQEKEAMIREKVRETSVDGGDIPCKGCSPDSRCLNMKACDKFIHRRRHSVYRCERLSA
jgi:hypothetical protein